LKEFEQVAQKSAGGKNKRFPKELDPLLNKVCSLSVQLEGVTPVAVFDRMSKASGFASTTLRVRTSYLSA
jgi:hypothetical protein